MQIGQAQVDFKAHEINGPAGNHTVEPKVMQVLAILVENAGEVVTRENLIDQVWGVGYGGDERLSRAISLLRKSLGDSRSQHAYIQTIPKTGYKLTVDIETPDQESSADNHAVSPVATTGTTKSDLMSKRALIGLMGAGLAALAAFMYFGKRPASSPITPPLVMIMDSAHPARIYDEQITAQGGTNADILSDIFADLPIRTQKELISPNWNRYEAMTQFEPELIVIHYSGFKQEDGSGDRPQLRLLVEYFHKSDTEFLVYSRASRKWLSDKMDLVLKDIYAQDPALRQRIDIFPLLEYGEPKWQDPASAQAIKLKVKDMLQLD